MNMFPNTSLNRTRQAVTTLSVVYVLLLSYLTLAPDPWWIFGSGARTAEEAIDSTLADYVQHAAVYAVLGILLAAGEVFSERPVRSRRFEFGLLHAAGTELLQFWIPARWCDLTDGAANVAGVAAGWFLVQALRSRPAVAGPEPENRAG